jgi:hypothetical protein
MINWFIDNNVGVSVGMISNSFNGVDPIMYDVLKRCVAVGMDKCAIWNHGMDAAFRYGEATTLEEVQARVEGCDTKIKQFFPGYKPFLMAPHQNSWGPFLIQALKNLDYKIVSAAEAAYSGMQWNLTMNPMQMPQQATTGDFSATINDFVGVPVSKTVADCEAAAARGEVCVIMTHPHEFANGAYNLTTLAKLVQTLQDHGFTSTNFYNVMNEQMGIIPPTNQPVLTPTQAPFTITVSTNGRCGVDFQHTSCGNQQFPCCSKFGWCGNNATVHCGTGCQSPYGLCGHETYAPRASPTAAPSITPTTSPTRQPTTSVPTVTPSLSPTASPIQYTAIIHVVSSSDNQYQWTNVLETIGNVEKDQNLIDLQYSGNTEVLASSSEFDISVKMTFGLGSSGNQQTKYDTTATLLSRAISQNAFDDSYHNLGTDKKTTFTSVTFQGDGSFVHQINSAGSSPSKQGLFSFPMSSANIGILVAICVSIVLVFLVVGYLGYRRWYATSQDEERKRANTISTSGSNEEMLSPSERFVELELKSHYSVPKSDNNQFVEDTLVYRHGLNLPNQLENV